MTTISTDCSSWDPNYQIEDEDSTTYVLIDKDTEVTSDNLVYFLEEDANFVDFFNTFLSLPTFAQRLFYNTASQCFEEFDQALADDPKLHEHRDIEERKANERQRAFIKRRRGPISEARIAYYVKFLGGDEGLLWIQQNRLSSFLKSELYAEFKLARHLADVETNYLEILLQDATANCQNIRKLPAKRSNRDFTLFPGLELFHEARSITPPEADNSAAQLELSRRRRSWLETSKSTEKFKTRVPNQITESEGDDDVFFTAEDNKHGINCSKGKSVRETDTAQNDDRLKESLFNRQRNMEKRIRLLSQFMDDEASDSDDEGSTDDIERLVIKKVDDVTPMDLGIKAGLDAFKKFLVGTSGEKQFCLWIEVERWKHLSESERKRDMQNFRKNFLSAGAPYELSKQSKSELQRAMLSSYTDDALSKCQEKALRPLLEYWCPRFLLHNKIKLKAPVHEYITADHHCTQSRCLMHSSEFKDLPQRPVTCLPHYTTAKRSTGDPLIDKNIEMAQKRRSMASPLDERSKTVLKMRSKSAHPRITASTPLRETNVGYLQLLTITSPPSNDVGFRPAARNSYHNDAAENEPNYRRNIRLYIPPAPPPDVSCSVVKRVEGGVVTKSEVRQVPTEEETLSLLAEALLLEKHSGEHFLEYIRDSENKTWMDSYLFWRDLREYTECFFAETFRQTLVQQKATALYSKYITRGSARDINCSSMVQEKIYKGLVPPYEDLFDDAEDHILRILLVPWMQMLEKELSDFERLNREQRMKFLEVRRQEKCESVSATEAVLEPDENEEDEREKVSPEQVGIPYPVPKDGITFDSLLRDRDERQFFEKFLEQKDEKAMDDFMAWLDIESFRRLPAKAPKKVRDEKATYIGNKWLGRDYFFGPKSPATKDGQNEVKTFIREGGGHMPKRPPSPVILEAQRYIRARLERRWLMTFKETSEYINRRKAKTNVTEMVEDIMMKKRLQRSEAAWKILNSRWISGSRDVVALRQTLLDTEKCQQFKMFLGLKGELVENSVNFWLEVQRFKEFCHCHFDSFAVTRKIQAVIDVYIKSSIPPELQIDVPIEIAERLYEKACGKVPQHGPYLFREAQTTVFRILFSYWKEFLTFRATVEEDNLTQYLSELKKKHQAQRKAKKMITERRRLAKISAEKQRKEKEERERGRSRLESEYASLQSFDDEDELETKAFSYSKHLVEEELKELEENMRENGLTLEELTDLEQSLYYGKAGRSKKGSFADDMKSNKSFSAISANRQKQADPLNRRGGRRRESSWEDAVLGVPDGHSEVTKISYKKYSQVQKNSFAGLSSIFNNKSQGTKNISVVTKESEGDVKAGSEIKERRKGAHKNIMPGPHRKPSDGRALTMETLKEFNRISEGKSKNLPVVPSIGVQGEGGVQQVLVDGDDGFYQVKMVKEKVPSSRSGLASSGKSRTSKGKPMNKTRPIQSSRHLKVS